MWGPSAPPDDAGSGACDEEGVATWLRATSGKKSDAYTSLLAFRVSCFCHRRTVCAWRKASVSVFFAGGGAGADMGVAVSLREEKKSTYGRFFFCVWGVSLYYENSSFHDDYQEEKKTAFLYVATTHACVNFPFGKHLRSF